MKGLLSLPILIFVANSNAADMVATSETGFKALISCSAQAPRSGVSEVSKVQIVKEVDFDGNVIEGSDLSVVMLKRNGKSANFYVTHATQLAVGGPLKLVLWKYAKGSVGNVRIGQLDLDSELRSGQLTVNSPGKSLGLKLSNCQLADDFGT